MSATPARIGFIQSAFRRAVSTTAQAQTRYGALARQTEDPIPTFFDNVADAQVMADARQTLLSAERRRFRLACKDLDQLIGLSYSGALPIATYVDTERDANRAAIVSEITFDLQRHQAAITVWG